MRNQIPSTKSSQLLYQEIKKKQQNKSVLLSTFEEVCHVGYVKIWDINLLHRTKDVIAKLHKEKGTLKESHLVKDLKNGDNM